MMGNRQLLSLCATVLLALAPSQAVPQAGGVYEITRSTIDSGGGASSGGTFVLTGTIGQPDAQPMTAAGGNFKLQGGFWAHIVAAAELIFKNSFE